VPTSSAADIAAFRASVPLTSYDDIAPEVEAALHGAPDQLAPGKPIFFAMTSGTSGARKLIPLTEDYRRSFQKPMHLFIHSLQKAHPDLFKHRVLYVVGTPTVEIAPTGVPIGYISGFNYVRMPPLLQRFYAVPPAVFSISDPDANSYAIARTALMHDLSFAVGITTAPFASIARTLERHQDSLLRDIRDGTLTPPGTLTPNERRSLAGAFAPDPKRARVLEQRTKGEDFAPYACWPELDVVSCWYHAAAGSAKAAIDDHWRPKSLRSALYSATEGWLNVPLRDNDPSGVAAIDSVFFEFETLDAAGEPTGETCLIHEVEVGRHYGIVMTTPVGLWRYRLMDEIKVTGFFGRTPEFHFVQKVGAVLSAHHDLTSGHHFEQAFEALFTASPKLAGARWLVWPEEPDASGRGRYGAAIASLVGLDAALCDQASELLDATLAEANPIYGKERRSDLLGPVELQLVSPAAMDAWEEERARLSPAGNQAKPVRLIKDAANVPAAFRAALRGPV